MTASAQVPSDHPLMVAWEAHKSTDDYANSKQWAKHAEHVEGSLWALFSAGWAAAKKVEPAPAQPAGWQPIETAPKDGTEILGCRDDPWGGLSFLDVRVCSWEPLENPIAKEWGLAGTWHRRHVVSGKGLMGGSFQPTHWMPLQPLAAAAQEQPK